MRVSNLIHNPSKVLTRIYHRLNKKFSRTPKTSQSFSDQNLRQYKQILEQILTKNILPFWYPQVIDWEEGGYRLNHDCQGHWKGIADKQLVNQTQTVWFFSQLAATKFGERDHLNAARHGYEFLRGHLWDTEYGGFYWEIDSTGKKALKPDKHLYGQAFALYALSQYALVSKDLSAKALADELFNLLENHAHDSEFGGYREFFNRDWSAPPDNARDYRNNTSPLIKTLDTHLHLMEAFTPYYFLSKDSRVRDRLFELILIQSSSVVRKRVGVCRDKHRRDWVPLDGAHNELVNFGHELENVWFLIEACNAMGISNNLLMDLYRTLFGYVLQNGFDKTNGGFYLFGNCGARDDQHDKVWWVQAEGLVSALHMYRLTGEEIYGNCFNRTLDWIVKQQVDWKHGEWHADIRNGRPSGKDKAGGWGTNWKSPYHNGRAVLKTLELLSCLPKQQGSI